MADRNSAELYVSTNLSRRKGSLVPGNVAEEHFWFLIEISSIHSEKIILALRDYLVMGDSRKIVCERYGVNNGYFGTSFNRLYRISRIISQMLQYYIDNPK
ncbi:adhesin biosynthesis transcription regulatory family protein [Escherichia coli]|nr:transcriptional regulator [Escherichia coli]HAZ3680541.1 transcriptional regulator [Escherichia coli]HAZ3906577.1 transcriptional regulator [Escherichia coli]HBA7074347.1 transcriptional regulator [Escherichia coli]HBA7189240.1 transcriptional regulator [Escherichia coli]